MLSFLARGHPTVPMTTSIPDVHLDIFVAPEGNEYVRPIRNVLARFRSRPGVIPDASLLAPIYSLLGRFKSLFGPLGNSLAAACKISGLRAWIRS